MMMMMMNQNPDETKIIYHIDDEETPYLVKINVPPKDITLGDFKSLLSVPRPNYKYFFKSHDDDFGVVKEEICDDSGKLPIFKGRVVAWLVTADGSNISDTNSQCTDMSTQRSDMVTHSRHGSIPHERLGVIGESRPPSFHGMGIDHCGDSTCTETDSIISSRRGGNDHVQSPRHRNYHKPSVGVNRTPEHHPHHNHLHHHHNQHRPMRCDESSLMTSDIDTTSFIDSDDDDDDGDDITSRISTTTDETSVSRINERRHRRRRRRHRMPAMSRTSSISSITESTMSLNIITVTLNLDSVNFLGISIVGQSNKGGDGGIYVGSIMKGGAVALDGRIEPGDMILQVNDANFENMSNDDAVRVLREAVQKPGPIKLVVAKCWDPNPKGYFTIPRTEPVRPIDPGAWVAHTEAARANQFGAQDYPLRPPSVSTLTSTSSSITSSIPETERQLIMDASQLSIDMDIMTIAKSMAATDSGLDVRDRMWLKITIPNAFIGSDVVDWLYGHVQGFQDRREARKFANHMLKLGYIKHTVSKNSFSEQCYYVFGELILCGGIASLKVGSDGNDDVNIDHIPPPNDSPSPWLMPQIPAYTGQYLPPHPTAPFLGPWSGSGIGSTGGGEWNNYGMFGANPLRNESGSVHSGSGASVGLPLNEVTLMGERQSASPGASSDPDEMSQRSGPIPIQQSLHHIKTNGDMLQAQRMHNHHNHNNAVITDGSDHSNQSACGSSNSNHSVTTASTTTRDTVTGHLDSVSSEIGGSRQSFRMAMGNPCEFFVDVM